MTPRDTNLLRDVRHEIDAMVRRGRMIVAGPWLGEVGFEALYWIPFLHWVMEIWALSPDRMVAVSRGGVRAWYAGVASRYVEMWEEIPLDAFLQGNASRGRRKQLERVAFDKAILERVWRRLGTRDADVLHPSLMYRVRAWKQPPAVWGADAPFRFRPVPRAEPVIDRALLPPSYVAMKFYKGDCLPPVPPVYRALRERVIATARSSPVVVLDTGLDLRDGHGDYTFDDVPGVISARPWLHLQNNLGAQSQIVAGASAFVGPCGGITWIAPRLGVDTTALCVQDAPRALPHVAHALAAYQAGGRFRAQDPVTGAALVSGARVPTRPVRHPGYQKTRRNIRPRAYAGARA